MNAPASPAPPVPTMGVVDVESALQRAYNLGQTYWQQADSEYASYHRKASETAATFRQLVIDTVAALPAVPEGFVSREVLRNLIDEEIASWSKSDQRREVTHAMACLIQRLAATPAHDQPEGSDND